MFTGVCGPPEKLSLALVPRSYALRMIVKLAEKYSGLFGIDRIAGDRVRLVIFARLSSGKIAYPDFLGLIALIFVSSAILF